MGMDMMNARGSFSACNNAHQGPTTARTRGTAASSAETMTPPVRQYPGVQAGAGYYGTEYESARAAGQHVPTAGTTSAPPSGTAYAPTATAASSALHDYARSASSHAGPPPTTAGPPHHVPPGRRHLAASALARSAAAQLLLEHRARTAALLRQEATAYHYSGAGSGYAGAPGGMPGYPPPSSTAEAAEIAHLQAVLDAKRAKQRLRSAAAAHAAALSGAAPHGATAAVPSHPDLLEAQRLRELYSRGVAGDDTAGAVPVAAGSTVAVTSKPPPGPLSDDQADVLAAAQACLNLAGSVSPEHRMVTGLAKRNDESLPPKKRPAAAVAAAADSLLPPKTKFSADIGKSSSSYTETKVNPAKKKSKKKAMANSTSKRVAKKKDSSSSKKSVGTPDTYVFPFQKSNDKIERSACGLPLKKRKSLQYTEGEEEQQAKKPKKKGRKKENGMPRRPLSAYNIFFSEERERILKEIPGPDGDDKDDQAKGEREEISGAEGNRSTQVITPPLPSTVTSASADPNLTAAYRVLMERRLSDSAGTKKRRRHRRTHGKIGFKDLAKTIGARWKSLLPEEMEKYRKLAEIDMKRYQADMERYHAALRGEIAMPFGPAASRPLPAVTS